MPADETAWCTLNQRGAEWRPASFSSREAEDVMSFIALYLLIDKRKFQVVN